MSDGRHNVPAVAVGPPGEALACRYRRLLAWYPKEHRARHEEEMIGVLLAGAHPGQRHPGVRDTADLARGALLIRFGRAFGPNRTAHWQRALLIAALIGLTMQGLQGMRWLTGLVTDRTGDILPIAEWPFIVASALLPIGGLLLMGAGRRWPAAGLAWALIAVEETFVYLMVLEHSIPAPGPLALATYLTTWEKLVPLVATVSLTLLREPRRGLKSLGPARLALGFAGLLTAFIWVEELARFTPAFLAGLAVFAVTAGLALRSATGRRLLILLALPSFAYMALLLRYFDSGLVAVVGMVALCAVTAVFPRQGDPRAPEARRAEP
ncbi:hypothetical protein [Rhizohabitans arisaemae]|uniref:hypothetical protein n=1 Tax=Rhizohabitans arisaemae TaxID=2720610 RepID=UPI0024B1FDAD|nr:hypothetical protein [Rhizohabitans arisaemae]